MEWGDLAAVILGLSLVIVLTFLLSPAAPPTRGPPEAATPTPVPTLVATPVPVTTTMPSTPPTTPPFTPMRILYTGDYSLLPVRFLPSDMSMYGSSSIGWKYTSSEVFAYIDESHGGITQTFTVPYPVWRLNATLYATTTPQYASFRMILVDEETGQILDGIEIHFPGTVTRTIAARGRPLYMVIETENVDRFVVTFERPSPSPG